MGIARSLFGGGKNSIAEEKVSKGVHVYGFEFQEVYHNCCRGKVVLHHEWAGTSFELAKVKGAPIINIVDLCHEVATCYRYGSMGNIPAVKQSKG